MIKKMLKKFEELRMRYFLTIANGGNEKLDFAYGYVGGAIDQCKAIVQEVAKEYEDRVIELPVRIGEVIYSVECGEVVPECLNAYEKDNSGLWAISPTGYFIGRFGKTVFATRSEAEEALAKMGGSHE